MTGFWFGGGDQSVLLKVFIDSKGKDTPVLAKIRSNYLSKQSVIGGTSAVIFKLYFALEQAT